MDLTKFLKIGYNNWQDTTTSKIWQNALVIKFEVTSTLINKILSTQRSVDLKLKSHKETAWWHNLCSPLRLLTN
jgi:hypothetical protein